MATKTKHMERSHRSYSNNIVRKQGFYTNSIRNAETDKYAKQSRKSLFSRLFGKLRRNKEDK